MAKRNFGLGRSFDEIIGDNIVETPKGNTRMLRIADIEPNRGQPRKNFDDESLSSLAASIKEYGLLQPIIVTENKDGSGMYTVVAGERRWRASRIAGLSEISAIIFDGDELASAQVALVENIQRRDLTAVEEAIAYRELIEKFGLTQEEVSDKVGRSRPSVTNSLRLLELPNEILKMIENGDISMGHARTILGLADTDDEARISLAEKIIETGMSVRETERLVKLMNTPKKEKKSIPERDEQAAAYYAELEQRIMKKLGRRVKINDKGNGKRHIELDYESNDDLTELLIRLCGDDIFAE